MLQLNQKVDTTILDLDHKSETMNEKLALVEPTSEVMLKVQAIVDDVETRLTEKIENNFTNLDTRIKKIYSDELTFAGKFGPNEDMYKTMRDFVVKGLEATAGV